MVLLKAQGHEFVYDCGPIDIDAKAEGWTAIASATYAAWNGAGQTEREWLFQHCEARKEAVMMVSAIVAKGITPPAGEL